MRIILQKILFLIALPVFFGTVVSAEENNSEKANDLAAFGDYNKIISQQKSTVQENTECTLIRAERMKILEYQREQRIMEDQKEQRNVEYQKEQRKILAESNIKNVRIVAYLYAISLLVIIILMWTTNHHAKDIVTIMGLVSVIFATLLLVLMINDTEQLIAPIGIFGAIAGYLFGTAPKKESQTE